MSYSYTTWQAGDIIQCFLKDAVPFKKELYTYLQVLKIKRASDVEAKTNKIEKIVVTAFDFVSPVPCTKEEVLSYSYVIGPYFTGRVDWTLAKGPLEMYKDIRIYDLVIQPRKFKTFQCKVIGNDLAYRETISSNKIDIYPSRVSAGIIAIIARVVNYEDLNFSL